MKVYAIRKVLVVDDDEWVHSGIASVLEEHFEPMVEVVGAFTAQAGFSAFFSEAPDIVFVDIHFGDDNTDGIELLQRVKRIGATSNIPFVLFSDRDSLSDQLAGLDEESMPDDFLSKPLPESELVAKIRQWDRVLHAERKLHSQKDQLQKRATELAASNIQALKQLSGQHAIAALGLFTRGLMTIFADTLLTVRGYTRLMELNADDAVAQEAAFEKLAETVLKTTNFPRTLLSSLRIYFESSPDKAETVAVVPVLDGLTELARHELKRHGLSIEKDLTGSSNCRFVPALFVQAVLSILLMFRDSAIPGSVLVVRSHDAGDRAVLSFEYPIRGDLQAEALAVASGKGDTPNDLTPEAPGMFSLRSALESASKLGAKATVTAESGSLTISVALERFRESDSVVRRLTY